VTAGRPARVVAAAGAALLAVSSLRTLSAETAYERGLDASVDPEESPALDLPGRLEHYEEAARRDPGEALYELRAGQVRLLRAARPGAAPDARELAAARASLERAAELRPLDYRPRAQLALASRIAGEPERAMHEARAAMAVGPRAPAALRTAVEVGLWAWSATGDASSLRTALVAGAALARLGESSAVRLFAPTFAAAGAGLAQDLVEATRDDAVLAAFAAAAARPVRPEAASVLDPDDGRPK
jgi:hypothetical protein